MGVGLTSGAYRWVLLSTSWPVLLTVLMVMALVTVAFACRVLDGDRHWYDGPLSTLYALVNLAGVAYLSYALFVFGSYYRW